MNLLIVLIFLLGVIIVILIGCIWYLNNSIYFLKHDKEYLINRMKSLESIPDLTLDNIYDCITGDMVHNMILDYDVEKHFRTVSSLVRDKIGADTYLKNEKVIEPYIKGLIHCYVYRK